LKPRLEIKWLTNIYVTQAIDTVNLCQD